MAEQKAAEVIATFGECPRCKGKRRMMETLGNELKEEGLIGKDLTVSLSEVGGTVIDPRQLSKLLVGGTMPGAFAAQDVCLDCGKVYTVRIVRRQVPTSTIVASGQMQKPPGVS